MEPERTIYEASPSQYLNLKAYIFCLLMEGALIAAYVYSGKKWIALLFLIPWFIALVQYARVKTMKVKLTSQRIIVTEGILNKLTNETELYRVRDTSVAEPLALRMFGLGNIHIFTTDDADKVLMLRAYSKPHWLKDQVRNYAEECRRNKRWGNDQVMIQEQNFDQ